MKYRVVIHEMARQDIRRNARWWADNHSRAQSEVWFHNTFDCIEKLTTFPSQTKQASAGAVASATQGRDQKILRYNKP